MWGTSILHQLEYDEGNLMALPNSISMFKIANSDNFLTRTDVLNYWYAFSPTSIENGILETDIE